MSANPLLTSDDIHYFAGRIAKSFAETQEVAMAYVRGPHSLEMSEEPATIEVDYDGNANKIVASHSEESQDDDSDDTVTIVDTVVVVPQPKKAPKAFLGGEPSPMKRKGSKFMTWRKSKKGQAAEF